MRWCWSTQTSSCAKWWRLFGRRSRRRGSDPSPGPRPLVKARGAVHPLPWEREKHFFWRAGARPDFSPLPRGEGCSSRRARSRPAIIATFSAGRRWTATGVLTSRRGPDEGSLPPPRPPVACHA
jgi:hypothetical protein